MSNLCFKITLVAEHKEVWGFTMSSGAAAEDTRLAAGAAGLGDRVIVEAYCRCSAAASW